MLNLVNLANSMRALNMYKANMTQNLKVEYRKREGKAKLKIGFGI